MADKVTAVTTTSKILTADNIRITMFNEANIGQALTEAEIIAILDADSTKELIVRNKTSEQIEWWFVVSGQKIRRKLG